MLRTVAVTLKIPDNEAFTALSALQRLGVDVARVERAEIWQMHDEGGGDDFRARVERNESLFNPNKHQLHILEHPGPRSGEAWVERLDAADISVRVARVARARRYVAWRLFAKGAVPAAPQTVLRALEQLLCNPAIERAITE